jgi:hypothetical protein
MKICFLHKPDHLRHWGTVSLLLVVGAATVWASAEYFTGFEAPDFTVGPLPQQGWVIDGEGTAQIQTSVKHSGAQALEIAPASVVDRDLSADVSGDIIWIDAFARVTPQDTFPDPADVGPGSSLIHFSTSKGIACYDGNYLPDPDWVSTGVTVSPTQWYRITIRQDYRTQTWDCYVDGERKLGNLGFKDALTLLSGFKASSSASESSYLDNFWVGNQVPAYLFPDSEFQTLFEFSTLWGSEFQTAYSETLFRLYDLTQDDVIDALDLYLLVADLRTETDFN